MLVVLAGLAALAGSAPPTSSGRWNLKIEAASCVLERQIAEPPAMLIVSTMPGSDYYRIAVTAEKGRDSRRFGTVSLTFAPSPKEVKGYGGRTRMPDGRPAIEMDGLPPVVLDQLATATAVTMATEAFAGTVSVTSPAKAVEALRRCSADQMIEWGADPAQFAPGGVLPVATRNRDDWLSKKDLMAVSRLSYQGETPGTYRFVEPFRVAISTSGAIDGCVALSAPTAKQAEALICAALLGKPLFTPARGPGGQPVRGVGTFNVAVYRKSVGSSAVEEGGGPLRR